MNLDMPASNPVPSDAGRPLQPVVAAGLRKLDILLVEDHEDTLRAMSRLLQKLDHRVTTANCVKSAIKAANICRFDLVISDLGLPDGTGLDLMRELRTMYPLKGIALTGFDMQSDMEQTREAGFQLHLTKPISFGELQAAIEGI